MLVRIWSDRNSRSLWRECRTARPHWKIVLWFLRKRDRLLLHSPVPVFFDICQRSWKLMVTRNLHMAALLIITKSWKKPRCPPGGDGQANWDAVSVRFGCCNENAVAGTFSSQLWRLESPGSGCRRIGVWRQPTFWPPDGHRLVFT